MRLMPLFIPATLLAGSAMADITADDVWANTTAFYRATGGSLDATLTRDGETVFIDDVSLIYSLPYGIGQVIFAMPPMTMIDEADGTVTQKLAKSFDVGFRVEVDSFMFTDLALTAVITQADFAATVSGRPGEISYTRSAGAYSAIVDFQSDELGLDLSFDFAGEGYVQKTQVEEGDLIKVIVDHDTEVMRYNYQSDEEFGYSSEGSGEYGAIIGRWEAALPAAGLDLLNPSAAISEGMFIRASSTQTGSRDEATTYYDGELMTRDSTVLGPTQSTFALSEDGLSLDFDITEILVTFADLSFGEVLIDVAVDAARGEIHIPLMPRDTAQTATLKTEVAGLSLSDAVWDQFDPNGTISRTPADLTLDATSDLILAVDLMDFDNIEDAFFTQANPIAPVSLSVNRFALNGAGVSAEGDGAFTFDNTDTTTFNGLPRPEGEAEITVSGTNALLDQLIDLGVLDAGDASMARMSLGMFTRPAGDNALTAKMAVTPDGHVMVNGERLR